MNYGNYLIFYSKIPDLPKILNLARVIKVQEENLGNSFIMS